jgi:hypothetical protein
MCKFFPKRTSYYNIHKTAYHGRMARGTHGLPKVSPGPAMPCRWASHSAGGLQPSCTPLDTPRRAVCPCREPTSTMVIPGFFKYSSSSASFSNGEFHDQADAKWILISGQLRDHNDTPYVPTGGEPPAGLSAARGLATLSTYLAFSVTVDQ